MAEKKIVVFVHGWSVSHTNTFGKLPERLINECKSIGIDITVKEIFLSEYISFHDEVRLEDISRAFHFALSKEVSDLVKTLGRFICITHSTGGPVIRDWWNRYYLTQARSGPCPISHLIMLAPANFGSALAQLGKSRLCRIKTFFEGVEPGTGVLDWLELGSPSAWELNTGWIQLKHFGSTKEPTFPFVLSGQTIDRKLFDHLNTYTGELGSDGVVRLTSANLNSTLVKLEQEPPKLQDSKKEPFIARELKLIESIESIPTCFRIVRGKSHSGTTKGIMRSIQSEPGNAKDADFIQSLLACIQVKTMADYKNLQKQFVDENLQVQQDEQVEFEDRLLLPDNYFIHDRFSMVLFRIHDDYGYVVDDYDLILTAGEHNSPDHLPKGFFMDRQKNTRHKGTLTYYFNYDAMCGNDREIVYRGKKLRDPLPGATMLGLKLIPRPSEGFVHYLPCEIKSSKEVMQQFIQPNQTTLVDITLRRIVHEGIFTLRRGIEPRSFKNNPPGDLASE